MIRNKFITTRIDKYLNRFMTLILFKKMVGSDLETTTFDLYLSETASIIWIILAILLSILLILIVILGAFIIRNRLSRSRGSAEASNYTLGSSSGCTDQLVMTSSPSATEHGAMCDSAAGDSEHFIYINTSRNIQKPNIFHNHRLSHVLRPSGKHTDS